MAGGNQMSSGRYQRQLVLEQIGPEGQARLQASAVLVIGAGGLGCPALQYLTGAGVGRISLVDADTVDVSNLHRQPLYGESDLGQPKVEAARRRLKDLNPDVLMDTHPYCLTPANAERLIDGHDLVLDCADSFAASYILSDRCRDRRVPLISASAIGVSGYAGGFCGSAPSLRAVFPDLPASAASCDSAGVLGPVVGLLGALQAQMALAILLELTPSPLGQLVSIDALRLVFGGFDFSTADEPAGPVLEFIDSATLDDNDYVIDLRSAEESAELIYPDALRRRVDEFEKSGITPPTNKRIVLCCQSGLRAWRAARKLKQYHDGEIALKVKLGVQPTTWWIPVPSHWSQTVSWQLIT